MVGTSVHLSTGWIRAKALSLGITEAQLREDLHEFGEKAKNFGAKVEALGDDFEVLFSVSCSGELPNLDYYLEEKYPRPPDAVDEPDDVNVVRVSDEERERRRKQFAEQVKAERDARRSVHAAVREKLGMPPSDR